MTRQKYNDVVNFARVWMYQMYLQDISKLAIGNSTIWWNRSDFWTAMLLATDQPDISYNVSKNSQSIYTVLHWVIV